MNEIFYRDDNGDILTESELDERFDDMLDECYDELRIGELSWAPSVALERLDPVAYRCYRADFLSEFEELTEDELDETVTVGAWY